MARYDYQCPEGHQMQIERSMHEQAPDHVECPLHGQLAEWIPPLVQTSYKWTPGKETGIYDYDYGKFATQDLTVPGKIKRLHREGRIDPTL